MTPNVTHAALRTAAIRAAAIHATYDYLTDGVADITLKIYSVSNIPLCTMTIPDLTLDLVNYRITLDEATGTCTGTGIAGYAVLTGKAGTGNDLLSVGESGAEIVLDYDDLFAGLLVSLSADPLKRRLQG